MRQLKGKTKETSKQRKERKKEFSKAREHLYSVVLPTLAIVFLSIVVYVYLKTRPKPFYTDDL
ncbi:single-pass membrane and coiled-coil domain-containing protein 4 [Chrysoperla carnea]|uniref:single-pass membrane and coiled-coil domain-containing protein 4 n=1 Tax=Chrysoperla carnea TaxID=189513 RepID=UPI001D07ACD6|nr:single-pass membrane and coiled-coil domain-containing protein 4 [Chrysoperla carnea]XP_044736424.1 single-pass membrane and coiled-coil domain-containing protein 4 [Chrysoperla carnea]